MTARSTSIHLTRIAAHLHRDVSPKSKHEWQPLCLAIRALAGYAQTCPRAPEGPPHSPKSCNVTNAREPSLLTREDDSLCDARAPL